LRAPEVAAAIGRGLERGGLEPPDLCPIAAGGAGTIEVLLPRLGGETAAGFALLDGGGTAIVEDRERIAAAAASGAEVVVYCAADDPEDPGDTPVGPTLVALTGAVTPVDAWAAAGARTVNGATFVLGELQYTERMLEARAVVLGAGALSRSDLRGLVGEAATRARQNGVPAHAIAGADRLDLFDRRILDLQHVLEARTLAAIEDAAERLAALL